MPFIVEQKIKGRTYLYEVESYYDKTKKQSRQKRKYMGRKPSEKSVKIEEIASFVSKNYGNVFLLEELAKKLKLSEILSTSFPEHYKELLSLAYYQIIEADPVYLFEHWVDEHYTNNCKRMDSSAISKFTAQIGDMQNEQFRFFEQWTKQFAASRAIYYDITSISSYSENIDYVESGYNRNNEQLRQINLAVVSCQKSGLPLYYQIYPGSIVDVATFKNTLNYLQIFELNNILLVNDKGFFSTKNVTELHNGNFQFIMPVPFTLKQVKNLVKKHNSKINSPLNAFQFNNEILFYQSDILVIDKITYTAHIYFNEKRKVEQIHVFLNKMIEIEKQFTNDIFESRKQYNEFTNGNLGENAKYFKYNAKTKKIEKDESALKEHLSKMGFFITLSNSEIDKVSILNYYRKKDMAEKIFDNLKNELDGSSLHVDNQRNTEARAFINFLSLILYSHITKVMQDKNLFKKFTIKEVFAELKNIKITSIKNQKPFLSEVTKTQILILEAFGLRCQL